MLKIPRKQVLDRWDSLTDNLREALCSEQNANILWAVSEKEHIPQEKIYTIATLAGDVILGFAHPYDLAQDIRNELGVNPTIAQDIASEVDRKIFTPIRMDLEKVYSPPIEEAEKTEEEILDLRKKTETPLEYSGNTMEMQLPQGAPAEMPELIITEEKPKTIPITEPLKVEQPAVSRVEPPKIIPTEEKKIQFKEVQPPKVSGQFKEVEPPRVEAEGPLIIHKEAELKPFGESKKSLGGFFGFLRKSKPEEIKPSAVRAEVKFGNTMEMPLKDNRDTIETQLKKEVQPPKIESPRESALSRRQSAFEKPRVVHYSEFETPISPFPQDASKNVNADKSPTYSYVGDKRGLYTEIPELIITEEKPKIENLKSGIWNLETESGKKEIESKKLETVGLSAEPPKIISTEEKKLEQINADKDKNLRESAPKKVEPPKNLPVVNQVEPPVMSRVEPSIPNKTQPFIEKRTEPLVMNQIKPPVANRFEPLIKPPETSTFKPPLVNPIKPVISETKPPMMSEIKPAMGNGIRPPVMSGIKPPIAKIPEIKVEEKKSPASHLSFWGFLKTKFMRSPKPLNKKPLVNEPLVKSPVMNKIEPLITSKFEAPAFNEVQPPAVKKVEPFKTSPSTGSGINRVESSAANRVEPLAVSKTEPPKPDSAKPGDDMIDLNLFK